MMDPASSDEDTEAASNCSDPQLDGSVLQQRLPDDDDDDSSSGALAVPAASHGSRHSRFFWKWTRVFDCPLGVNTQSNLQAVLVQFGMTPNEREALARAVSRSLYNTARDRTKEDLPVRWCYVPTLPTVRASGKCLTLYIGCSENYFRASLFNVSDQPGHYVVPIDYRTFLLTQRTRQLPMNLFSDYLATCLKQMLAENNIPVAAEQANHETLHVGVAAGFDVRVKPQRNPASAVVYESGKEFHMVGFLNEDFVSHFHAAFKRAGVNIEIGTVINDAVGILLSGMHQASQFTDGTKCSIGLLSNRPGANLAYLENDLDLLDTCVSIDRQMSRQPSGAGFCAIVNPEIGYYLGQKGELRCIANAIETSIAKELKRPLRLESIISGVWYPKILQRTLRLLCTAKILDLPLDKQWKLEETQGFSIFTLCDHWQPGQSGSGATDSNLASGLQQLMKLPNLSGTCAAAIVEVCRAIVSRTAEVSAVALVTTAHQFYGRSLPGKLGIAYGGGLFSSLSQLKPLLEAAIKSLVPIGTEIIMIKSDVEFGCAVTAICSTKPR